MEDEQSSGTTAAAGGAAADMGVRGLRGDGGRRIPAAGSRRHCRNVSGSGRRPRRYSHDHAASGSRASGERPAGERSDECRGAVVRFAGRGGDAMEAERSAAGGGHRRGWVRRHGIPASWLAEFRRMGIRQGSRPAVAVVGGTAEAFVRRPDAGSLGRMALEPQAVVRSSLYEAKPEYESDLALPFFALDPSGTGTGTDGNEIGRNPLVSVKAMLFKKTTACRHSPAAAKPAAGLLARRKLASGAARSGGGASCVTAASRERGLVRIVGVLPDKRSR